MEDPSSTFDGKIFIQKRKIGYVVIVSAVTMTMVMTS